ncbi:MAG TPA: hypothetical protein VK079_03890 [Bacillota bacterium]|nr:hypothetical protein [Bacillota bacterium]
MKLIFIILLLGLIIFLNLGLFIPSLTQVDEDDIRKNLQQLKKYTWFQNLLNNEAYKQLIVHDRDTRKFIGKLNLHKLAKKPFQIKYQQKLEDLLEQKANKLA